MVSWRSPAFHNRKSRPGEREGAFARRRTEEGSTMPRSGRSTAGSRSAAERQPEPRPGWHGASARLGGDSTTRYDDAAAPTKKARRRKRSREHRQPRRSSREPTRVSWLVVKGRCADRQGGPWECIEEFQGVGSFQVAISPSLRINHLFYSYVYSASG